MNKEERVEATEDIIAEIEELRENQKYAMHSTEMAMFHDVRTTLDRFDDEVCLFIATVYPAHVDI